MRIDTLFTPLALIVILAMSGCQENENQRLAAMSERHEQRQAEQSRQAAELHLEVIGLQRQVQTNIAEIGRQRDALESERRIVASERRWDSLTSTAIANVGLLLACLAPLVLACLLLLRSPESGDEPAIAEILLNDLTATRPSLANSNNKPSPRRLTENENCSEKST
ncbi:hypothetical protein [Blastopirellula marina]|uniref:Uncharacterized protein n=1 Tax=Blastopirellula marina DSM 3645 TaxID=314230 RepID=A3ZSK7_9BACT|nr:hypothetical protein [Blastopirellula marina]EAQ80667.1 hypothetical protein DSM3645_15015 [Blastopirellula marina DSM 3645]